MLLGINMLLWTPAVSEQHFNLFARIKRAGYDGAELPIFGGDPEEYRKVGQAMGDEGLRATAVTIIPDMEHSCLSSDAKVRAAALSHLKWAVDCLAAANGEVLCGPYYHPLGVFTGDGPTAEETASLVDVHKAAARYAAAADIKLSVEPLNRFECYALNTVSDAAEIVKRVDEPNYGLLYDTFHANIEEKDPVATIAPALGQINHVHTSENDRGTPGKGHVPWAETFSALKSGGFDGWHVIEAFGRSLPEIAEATRVWRDFFPSPDEVVEFGHDFLRRTHGEA